MPLTRPAEPLSEDDLDCLESFLAAHPGAMSVEELDGFVCALVVGPEVVMPSEWLPIALGTEDLVWENTDEAKRIFSLLLRHWNDIAAGFRTDWSGIDDEAMRAQIYLPLVDFEAEADQPPLGQRWAHGFGQGLAVFGAPAWDLIDSDEVCLGCCTLIAALDAGKNERGEVLGVEQRKELLAGVVAGVQHLYRLFRSGADEDYEAPLPYHAPPKVGRNDPCPCGSGRKFKKCCGAAGTVH